MSSENVPATGTVTADVGATKFAEVPAVDGIRKACALRTVTPGAGSWAAGKPHPTPSKLPSVLVCEVATPAGMTTSSGTDAVAGLPSEISVTAFLAGATVTGRGADAATSA